MDDTMHDWHTLRELADELGLTYGYMHLLVRQGRIQSYKRGTARFLTQEQYNAAVAMLSRKKDR